jgi:hypothetical protein
MGKKLSIEIETQLAVMIKYSLTAEEYFVTQLIFLATEDPPHPELLITYFGKAKKDYLGPEILQSLKDKGVLAKSYHIPQAGETFRIADITFDKTFVNEHFKLTLEAGAELKDAYPDFLQGFDRLLPAKNIVTAGYRNEEDFFFAYSKKIKHSRKNHAEVMEILEWAKEQKLLTYGMVEYVTTSKWLDHMKMRDEGTLGSQVIRVDTLEGMNE